VTEEQQSRLAAFGETLPAEAFLAWFFVARRSSNQAEISLSSNIQGL
jgi:hypothetical protein